MKIDMTMPGTLKLAEGHGYHESGNHHADNCARAAKDRHAAQRDMVTTSSSQPAQWRARGAEAREVRRTAACRSSRPSSGKGTNLVSRPECRKSAPRIHCADGIDAATEAGGVSSMPDSAANSTNSANSKRSPRTHSPVRNRQSLPGSRQGLICPAR